MRLHKSVVQHADEAPTPHNSDYGVIAEASHIRPLTSVADITAAQIASDLLSGYRGNTHAAYARDLADFFAYCSEHGLEPLHVRRPHVATYLRYLEARHLAPTTIARRLVAVRNFFTYAVEEHNLAASPTVHVSYRTPRQGTTTRSLTHVQLQRLLVAADDAGPRAAALVWLLATTGLRISEACALRTEDIHTTVEGTSIEVTCKGRIRRTVPVHDAAARRLKKLTGFTDRAYVFATRSDRPLDRHNAARLIRAVSTAAGVAPPASPHVLRHTFVTLARQSGCALQDVQDAVGHRDPATTRRYDHTPLTAERHPASALIAALSLPQ